MALPTDGKLISSLGELEDLTATGKYLLVQTGEGVKLAKASDFLDWIIGAQGGDHLGAAHNSIWRGKDITDQYYSGYFSEQVAAQTFQDIFPGDYIVGQNSGEKYRLGDINYRLGCGDTECVTPHVLAFPERSLYTGKMNETNTTTGAYQNSLMRTSGLNAAKTTIKGDLGADHILLHRNLFQSAITGSYPSSGGWEDSDIDLMNEKMVYGSSIFAPGTNPTDGTIPYNYTIDKSQIAAFRLCPEMIICRDSNGQRTPWWLRYVVGSTTFAHVHSDGNANASGASSALGVRPAFLLK